MNMKDKNSSLERHATSLKDVRCLSETGCVGRQRCLVFMSLASLRLSRDAKDAKDGLDIFLMYPKCCYGRSGWVLKGSTSRRGSGRYNYSSRCPRRRPVHCSSNTSCCLDSKTS